MLKFVNAKINLGLNVIKKRKDGYHDLETVFYPIGIYNGTAENPEAFCDILEICTTDNRDGDQYNFAGNEIDCPLEKNLVFKSVETMREAMQQKDKSLPGVIISLVKNIPDGAGLGGGSADASFTLVTLNNLMGNPLSDEELKKLANEIGADCPFFIENKPLFASGTGDILSPVNLTLRNFWALILKPNVYISTREAFSGIKPKQPDIPIKEIITQPIETWGINGLKNDFEATIIKKFPELKIIKEFLYKHGALYASMSGSGSSFFGIFASRQDVLSCQSKIPEARLPFVHSYICKL